MRSRLWIPESSQSYAPPIIACRVGIAGHFVVELVDAVTDRVKRRLEFDNLITDAGLDLLGGANTLPNLYAWLEVGTGDAPVSESDTKLAAPLSPRTNNADGNADKTATSTTPEFCFRQISRVFTESQANGTLAELGFWNSSTGGTLVNRALFRNAAGEATTIDKTPSEKLRVVFQYRLVAPAGDVTGSTDLYTGSYGYTLRAQGVNLNGQWIGLLDSFGSWSASVAAVHEASALTARTTVNNPTPSSFSTSMSLAPYVTGSFQRDITLFWDATAGNLTNGVRLITISPFQAQSGQQTYQMLLDAKLLKNSNQKFQLTFRQSWGRG